MHERVEQYEAGLPVGVHAETGELVTFEQARRDPECVIATDALTDDQRLRLAMARVEQAAGWPERELHPGGFFDRERALREMPAGGEIGELLVTTEVRVAAWVVDALRKEAADG